MSTDRNSLAYNVSNFDIQGKIGHKLTIVQYKNLFEFNDLLQLIPDQFSILVILINTAPQGGGHWTLLVRQNKHLTYFDSYGKGIDQELKYISDKQELHENKPYLSLLVKKLTDDGYTLTTNKIAYQAHKNNINTCGKWIIFIAIGMLQKLDLKEIQTLLKDIKQDSKASYDEIVNYYFNYCF